MSLAAAPRLLAPRWITRTVQLASDLDRRWLDVDILTLPEQDAGPYVVGFAVSQRAVEAALRLRYEIFNLELHEGLHTSRATGLDRDAFDDQMAHLVMIDRASGELIGTYRLQTTDMARAGMGFYSGQEYELGPLSDVMPQLVELGRACIAKHHRSLTTILQLWLAIGGFLNLHRARYLFGCCSLTTVDPDDGWRAMRTLRTIKALDDRLVLPATPAYSCGPREREFDPALKGVVKIPKLFSVYLRLGAKVISEPAIDREFGTVDFLMLMDGQAVNMSALHVLLP